MDLQALKDAEYTVSGLRGFTFSEALRLWKTKFETVKHFQRDVIRHPALAELGDFAKQSWEEINAVTAEEAMQEANMERRRVMFDCIGVSRLFAALEPELLDRQVVSKKRTRWNSDNASYIHGFEDVYELYKIDGKKLFAGDFAEQNAVYAVRCWCTTTSREYWIYVPEEIALGRPRWSNSFAEPDAIRAIAWTIRIDVSEPKRLYRQGDIIIAEESSLSKSVDPYHLTKEQYLQLMFSET